MKIKRLEITGFKSFVERTALDFDAGITSIVGPNGCGKSNIVDAIRWVMGEQSARHLRGRTMEDVIFGGSENRKPLGMAEVSLVMDNQDGACPTAYRDYAEIQVCRRLYRNGDSEYLLNKAPCRLLDITELFMDTGVGNRAYSIIEQGKIGMIVNARPEERRALIEEAAGVTKFKSRKKSALRKIEATQQNLLRLNDIVGEVRRQMNTLKRQAQRAQKFREFREELKSIDLQFGLRELRSLTAQVEQAAAAAQNQADQLDLAARQLEQAELDLERVRVRHLEREKSTTVGQEQVFALSAELQNVEGRLEFAQREIEGLDRQQDRIVTERAAIERRLQESGQEETDLARARDEQARAAELEVRNLLETENRLQALHEQEKGLSESLEQERNRLYHLLSDLSRMNSRQEEASRRLLSLTEVRSRNQHEALSVKEQLEKLEARNCQLAHTLSSLEAERDQRRVQRTDLDGQRQQLQQDVEGIEAKLLDTRTDLSRQGSRLESLQQLEQNLTGYGRGVKAVLGESRFKSRMQGLVADCLDVPPRYEAATEAVLGERLQSLLPDAAQDAAEALRFLRDKEGRCTFLLPDWPAFELPKLAGATPLVSLIGCPEAPGLVDRLLGGVFMVAELTSYVGMPLPTGVTLVNEDGDLLDYRGMLTGGGKRVLDQGVLHQKREIKDLSGRVKRLSEEVARLDERREGLRSSLAMTEQGLRVAQDDLYRLELGAADARKDLAGLNQDQSRLQERLEVLSLEEDQLHEEHEALNRGLEQSTAGRIAGEQQKQAQEQRVARLHSESQQLRLQADLVRQQVTVLKVSLAGLREREESARAALERAARLAEELAVRQDVLVRERTEALERREGLHGEIRELTLRLEVLFSRRLEAQRQLDRRREDFETSRRDIEERDAALRQLRNRAAAARDELAKRQMQSRELHLALEHLRQSFLDRLRIDLNDGEVAARFDEAFEEVASRQRRDYLLQRIDEIGEVNLMAIEEFEELEARYGFLSTQQDDLLRSLEGLQAAITKINRTTRKRFREAFDQVNAQFREVFPRLFNGGQAELHLTDENDLLETGIEIVAQPPGKKLQNVTLLSGGEKALTAVALIFAIFLIKPSPFCLLDEVDAPLDDANIGRFNELVKVMSETAQFIIITHNKRTMEIADNLYGVTMEEPGMSKMVSVRMREVA